jgi:hypothetical protein
MTIPPRTLLRSATSLTLLFFSPLVYGTLPTDNPIQTFYGPDTYGWTDEINWERVVDVTDFGAVADDGLDDHPAIHAAIAAVSAAGGGVVYFPPGTYHLSDNLVLSDGVVLRGAPPPPPVAAPAHERGDGTPLGAPAQLSDYAPPSRLVFPAYVYDPFFPQPNDTAFRIITVDDPLRASNWGLVHLDTNHARIINFPNVTPTSAFEQTNLNFNPEFDQRNVVIFGLRGNHMARPDPGVPSGSQGAEQRYPARGSANINLAVYENLLIANNRLNDDVSGNFEMPAYRLANGSFAGTPPGENITFKYTDLYGIVVNRFNQYSGGAPSSLTPDAYPETLRRGIVVRDNWLFNTMRVGYHISGQDLIIIDNVKVDEPGKWSGLNPQGTGQPTGPQTNENRGVDFSGFNVRVEGNDLDVHSHRLYLAGQSTPFIGSAVDGEAILNQAHTTTIVRGAYVNNNYVRGYIGIYKTGDSEDIEVIGNRIRPGSFTRQNIYENIYVVADVNNAPNRYLRNVLVANNILTTQDDVTVQGSGGVDNVVVRDHAVGNNFRFTPGVSSFDNAFAVNTPLNAPGVFQPRPRVFPSASIPDGAVVAEGSSVSLSAEVMHPVTIDRVEFWSNGQLLGTATEAPFSLELTDLELGERHHVFTRAVDTNGLWNWGMQAFAFRVVEQAAGLTYADWSLTRFADPASPESAPSADGSGRGYANAVEFALGLDLLEGDPRVGLPALDGEGALRFTRRPGAAVRILVESSETLEASGWNALATLEPGADAWSGAEGVSETVAGDLVEVAVTTGSMPSPFGKRFLRLRIELP